MPFESFRRLFKKVESSESSSKVPIPPENRELSIEEFRALIAMRSDAALSEEERAAAEHRLAVEDATTKEKEEQRQAQKALDDQEFSRRMRKLELQEAPERLRHYAMNGLPDGERQLHRALGESATETSEKDIPQSDESERYLHRFNDLASAVHFLVTRKAYLPVESYEANVATIRGNVGAIKAIIEGYRTSWAQTHEFSLTTKQTILGLITDLRRIDPASFPASLIELTDEEFRSIGSGDLIFRDNQNGVRLLLMRARLAEFDPERFCRIFGKEYSLEVIARAQKVWGARDKQYPFELPHCLPTWETIENALKKGQ